MVIAAPHIYLAENCNMSKKAAKGKRLLKSEQINLLPVT